MDDALREELLAKVGKPMGLSGPSTAPDAVNIPMIRHWVDALDDRNPAYDEGTAGSTRYGEIVAPPAMLQTWTMGRPTIEGIRERFYAISYERRITHPAVTAIAVGARTGVLKTA